MVIVAVQTGFQVLRRRDIGGANACRPSGYAKKLAHVGRRGTANERRRQSRIGRLPRREFVCPVVVRLILQGVVIIGSGLPILSHDALGQKIQHFFLGVNRRVGGEDVIEAAILAYDDDDMFDRRRRSRRRIIARGGGWSHCDHRVREHRANRDARA